MGKSSLFIRKKEYVLNEVTLNLSIVRQGEDQYLQFDIFADCNDLKTAGFAINCMSIEGLQSTKDIQGLIFKLGEDIEDYLNELSESVICEPGQVLELEHLLIKFGEIQNDFINIEIEAKCNGDIPVKGHLTARVKEE